MIEEAEYFEVPELVDRLRAKKPLNVKEKPKVEQEAPKNVSNDSFDPNSEEGWVLGSTNFSTLWFSTT